MWHIVLFLSLMTLGNVYADENDPVNGDSSQQASPQQQLEALMQLNAEQQSQLNTGTPLPQDSMNTENNATVDQDQANQLLTQSNQNNGTADTPQQNYVQQPNNLNGLDDEAFIAALGNTFPMTPEQIVQLRQLYDTMQLAQITEAKTPPRPTATSQNVNLATGETPPVIRLAQGFITSLVFLDSTSSPWPIASYDLGNPQAFNVQWDEEGNTLMIQALDPYTYGNLAVRLQGLATPVMLTLTPGQQAVDYRVDLRVQGYGPQASVLPTGSGLPDTVDPVLLSILDGVPPPGGQELSITGGQAQVWESNGRLFVRTRLTILSPSWMSTVSSADGMKAYEMQKTPIILISDQGKIMQLKINGL